MAVYDLSNINKVLGNMSTAQPTPLTNSTSQLMQGIKSFKAPTVPQPKETYGTRVSNNLIGYAGYDASEPVSEAERKKRRLQGLRKLSDKMSIRAAYLTGDPRQIALAQEREKAMQTTPKTGSSKRLSVFDPKTRQPVATILESDFAGIAQAEAEGYIVAPLSGPSTSSAVSSERFGVYDSNTNELIGSVLKTNTKAIAEFEKNGKIIGQLRSPSKTSSQVELYQLVDKDNNFIKNITETDFVKGLTDKTLPEGAKLTSIPTGTQAAPTPEKGLGEIKGWNDDDGLLERAKGFNGLVSSGNRIIENLYKNPGSVLITGDISQVFAQMSEEMSAIGYLIDPKKKDAFVNKATSNVRDQFRDLAASTSITESQLLDFAYQIAKVRGQEGRGLSDQDFKNFQKIISAGRTADQKIAALTNFIEGIQVEVESALGQEKKYREIQANRNEEDKEAAYVLQGIEDVYSVGFGSIFNPYAQQTPSASSLQNDPLGIR